MTDTPLAANPPRLQTQGLLIGYTTSLIPALDLTVSKGSILGILGVAGLQVLAEPLSLLEVAALK